MQPTAHSPQRGPGPSPYPALIPPFEASSQPFPNPSVNPPPTSLRSRLHKSFPILPIQTNMNLGSFFKGRKHRQTPTQSPVNFSTTVKHKISSSSPENEKPQTWEEYLDAYSGGQLDIEDPPLPPISAQHDAHGPFQAKYLLAPLPQSEPIRQVVVNRLGYHDPPPLHHPQSCSTLFSSDTPSSSDPSSLTSPSTSPSEFSTSSGLGSLQDPSLSPRSSLPISSGTVSEFQRPSRLSGPLTLLGHPTLQNITKRCLSFFSATVSVMSVIDDDRIVVLAAMGNDGAISYRRDMSFCSHTILNSGRVFAIPDTAADWRFAHNPFTTQTMVRSYIGTPIFAPQLPGLVDSPSDEPVCIGVLCALYDHPRSDFSEHERTMLVQLAVECHDLIANWFPQKAARKVERRNSIDLSDWVSEPGSPHHRPQSSPVRPATAHDTSCPVPLSPQSPSFRLRQSMSLATKASFSLIREKKKCTRAQHPPLLVTPLNKCSTPFQSLSPRRAAKFDLATKLLTETLELSTAYLVAVLPSRLPLPLEHARDGGNSSRLPLSSKRTGQILVLSSYNAPISPLLNYQLHDKAIRNGTEGLIFHTPSIPPSQLSLSTPSETLEKQKADWQQTSDFAYDRAHEIQLRMKQKSLTAAGSDPNQSGMLVRVGAARPMYQLSISLEPSSPFSTTTPEFASLAPTETADGHVEVGGCESGLGGFVLAGFSHDPKRILGLEDLSYFKHFSRQLVEDVDDLFELHSHPLSNF